MDSTNSSNVAPENGILNRRTFKREKVLVGSDLHECFKNGTVCDLDLIADDGRK